MALLFDFRLWYYSLTHTTKPRKPPNTRFSGGCRRSAAGTRPLQRLVSLRLLVLVSNLGSILVVVDVFFRNSLE